MATTRYIKWMLGMGDEEMTPVVVDGKKVQGRTVRSAHSFTIAFVEAYGQGLGQMAPGVRKASRDFGINQRSTMKYLAISCRRGWLVQVRPGVQGEDGSPAVYDIPDWDNIEETRKCAAVLMKEDEGLEVAGLLPAEHWTQWDGLPSEAELNSSGPPPF